ncbi:MAG TPA: MFS transporter [Chloroflexota bacterium]|nr:MFS transporter [Chloroflexota bacterium]
MTEVPGAPLTRAIVEHRAAQLVEGLPSLPATTTHGRHIFFVLAVTAVLMNSIDSTIVAVAVPQLTSALAAPLVWVAWTITAYQLTQIVMLPLAGKLSDSLGRRQVFLFCVGMFTLGSLLCGLAPSIWFLVGARVVQAVGGGGLMPSAVGVISDHYQEHRAQARGLFTSVLPIGGIVGPNLGGFILEHWTWRDMFFVNVPIGIVVFAGAVVLLRSDGRRAFRRIDFPGIALYGSALILLLAALTTAAQDPELWRSPIVWGAVALSGGLVVIFLRHIRTVADPVMDYQLVARQPFLAANLYNLFFGAAVFGVSAFIPTYAVSHFGMSPLLSGAVLTPRSIAIILTSLLASLWLIRLGYRAPMIAGSVLVTIMLLLLGTGWTAVQVGPFALEGFWFLAACLTIGGAGLGLANPASSNASLDLAPERAAALTGVRNMFRLTGGVLSVTGISLALTFFADRGQGLSVIFGTLSLAMLVVVPLTLTIPDSARERRLHRVT